MSEFIKCESCPAPDSGPLAPALKEKDINRTLRSLSIAKKLGSATAVFVGRPAFPGSRVFQATIAERITAENSRLCADRIAAGECARYELNEAREGGGQYFVPRPDATEEPNG